MGEHRVYSATVTAVRSGGYENRLDKQTLPPSGSKSMANPNPTNHNRGAFKQGWDDALQVKQGTRARYWRPNKDTWMAMGYRFGNELGFYDKQLLYAAWDWSVKEYAENGWVDPSKFAQESSDDSLLQAVELETNIRTGAGFGTSEQNRKVERAAITFVSKSFKEEDWDVNSVESQKIGYDLICTKESMTWHVEVKGVSGQAQAFIITQREVRQAQTNPDFMLCIVTSASSYNPQLHSYTGTEFIEKFERAPLAYRAVVKEL